MEAIQPQKRGVSTSDTHVNRNFRKYQIQKSTVSIGNTLDLTLIVILEFKFSLTLQQNAVFSTAFM
jgi:hypothetical protein